MIDFFRLTDRIKATGGIQMKNILDKIKDFYHDFKKTKTAFAGHPEKHIPNILSGLRLIAVPFVLITHLTGQLLLSLGIGATAAFTDFLDGQISRKLHAHSEFGRKLDTLADKLLAFTLISLNLSTFPILLITMLLEVYIGIVNGKALLDNKKTKTNETGRAKEVFLYLTILIGLLSHLYPPVLPLVIPGFAITTIFQLNALLKYTKTYHNVVEEVIPVKSEVVETKPNLVKTKLTTKQFLEEIKKEAEKDLEPEQEKNKAYQKEII